MTTQNPKRSGCLTRMIRLTLSLLLTLLALLAVGYFYQRRATAADFEQFPPPGKRVDVGGYNLHIYCTGEGSPTVVVDTGNGDFSTGWQGIQPEVAKFTRICIYDRAGYGWSDASPTPRSAANFALELHTLLSKAGEEPPFLLAGHSLGGYTVRVFAHQYPDEVAGMVLVDAGHEDQLERFPPEYARLAGQQTSYLSVLGFMARFGLLRMIGNTSSGADLTPLQVLKLPPDVQPVYLMMMSHPSYFDTTLAELRALPESTTQVRAIHGLGDLPLIVLTAENTLDSATLQAIGMPTDFDAAQIQQTWLALQAELTALSTNSENIIVKGSTHAIELDKPDVVIEAIRKVVGMIKE